MFGRGVLCQNVIMDIKSNDNPLIIANKLSWFLTDSLRNESVNIYESICS